jgi:hypothetical protein
MKSVEDLILEKSYSTPYNANDLKDAYKLGQLNMLLELTKKLEGYPVNGLVRGIITEEKLSDVLMEISNEK